MKYENLKLKEFNKYINEKKVAVLGLNINNIPLIEYLNKNGAEVTIFDDREIDEIDKTALNKVISHGMKFYFGKNNLKNLKGFNLIFRMPHLLPTKLELVEEKERGAIITTEAEMILELCPGLTIGVTGSNGKTTISTIIYKILSNKGYRCFFSGDSKVSLFEEIDNITPEDIVILELSSFQLMGMKVSPKISVITNIIEENIEPHSCIEELVEAEKNIFKYQDKYGTVILNYDDEIVKKFEKDAIGKVIFFSSKNKISNGYIIEDRKIKFSVSNLRAHILDGNDVMLKGIHNFENIACSIAATRDLCEISDVKEALKDFPGVEHRLELIKETKDRIKWYNDSVSLNPFRTIAGLNSFTFKNMILIAGGYDTKMDYSILAKPILDNCKAIILFGETADKISKAVEKEMRYSAKKIDIYVCNKFEETVLCANSISVKGDIILFSPASSCGAKFESFEERGEAFKYLVKKITANR